MTGLAAPAGPEAIGRLRAWLLGGNTIAKAGIGILFVGLAFLVKYAAEHAVLPVELRLAGIAAVAWLLLGVGWRLRRRNAAYAQVLQGGAVAVLYLTLFAAFRFYGVLGAAAVFALMVLVAALAAALAVLQEAPALALVGALGGFATPLLVSTGGDHPMALFAYYLVLDLGIAAVAWFRTWRVLNLVGFVFTFGVATVWGVLSYEPQRYAGCQAFLVAYFLLFNAVLMLPARRLLTVPAVAPLQRLDGWVNGSLLFGLPTLTFVLQHGLVRHWPYGSAVSALVLAGFYVAMAQRMKRHPLLAVTFEGTLAVATVFLILVVPFALDARATGGAWALEGAGLVWLGLRQQRPVSRLFGYGLLLVSGLVLLGWRRPDGSDEVLFNAWFLSAAMLAVGSTAAAWFVFRARRSVGLREGEAALEALLICWGVLWALGAAGWQIDLFLGPRERVAAWLVGTAAIASAQLLLARRLGWPDVAWPAASLAPVQGLLLLEGAWQLDSPAEAGGWWAWPLALVVQALVLRLAAPQWRGVLRRTVHALTGVVLAGLGALQGAAITRGWGEGGSAWPWLGWMLLPSLLLLGLSRPAALLRWPVRDEPLAWRSLAAGAMAAGALTWTVLANVFSDGSAAPLPHLPLLNPLDIGIGFALVATAAWLRSGAAQALRLPGTQAGPALLAACGFVWLNAMLVRGFHHYAGVPYAFEAWLPSLPVQTGITLLWSVTALVTMWLAARRAQRAAWIAGAALLAAVVLKLLLVDLSGSGTVTRIVSFIGVGLLMLVIAYVAPLPAASAGRDVASDPSDDRPDDRPGGRVDSDPSEPSSHGPLREPS